MKNKALITVLAGSIAQLMHGADIETNSPVTGNWSDPDSWNAAGVVPDTYGFDSAIIHAGDVIDYDSGVSTPGGIVGPGGLSVIGGNSITIDGGTLTQNILTNEIRIGEGSGGAGDGILTIDNAGSFNSGAAVAVAIGASLGGGPGSGIVNLNEGTFTMGAGSAGAGLVVGLDGSTGVFNLGNGTGVAGTAVLDLATNNIGLGIGYSFAGPAGGTGTVAIKSDGVLNLGSGGIAVGTGAGTATLSISGGTLNGLAAGGGAIIVGDGEGTTGSLLLETDGTLSNSGELRIGSNGGKGTLTMTSGTLTLANELNIGRGVGATSVASDGQAFISGGAVSTGTILIGRDGGKGTLALSGAGTTVTANGNFYIGTAGSNGTVSMTGGTLTSTGVIEVGASGTGAMTITGGTVSSGAETRVGQGAAGSGVLDFSGTANWTVGGEFQVGNDGGTGVVNMTGGDLIANSWFGIGRTGGTGVFNLSGGTITKGTSVNTGTLDISTFNNGAASTTGTLNQTGGAVVNTVSDTNVGRDVGNIGFWNMFSGTATLANFHIGNEGVGTMNITGTDVVTITTTGQIEIGANGAAAVGTLNIDNPNATITVGSEMQLGRNGSRGVVHQSAGVVIANGGWFGLANDGSGPSALYDLSGGELHVNTTMEVGAEGIGELTVSGTGVLTAQNIHAGQRANGTGILTVSDSGSVTTSGQIIIGFGSANANVANISGGTVTSGSQTIVGEGAGNVGTMNITGGSLTVGDEFQIGNDNGNGVVNISGGAVQINQWGAIGRNGGTGVLNLSGGTITMAVNNRTFDIGVFGDGNIAGSVGTGTMNQTGGELINLGADTNIARDVSSVGIWNMQGGTATLNGLRIGASGNGTMNISGTDPVIVNANNIRIGGEYNAAGVGVLNIDNPNAVITSQFEMGTGRNGGHGEVHQSAGTLNAGGGWFGIANDGGSGVSGIYDISGGTLNALTANIELGADGQGQLLVTGTGQVNSGGLTAGVRATGTGTLLLADSGAINVSGNIVIGNGSANANVATITGGTMTSGNITAIGNNAGSVGTMNISGGLVTANGEFWTGNGGGNGTLNMTGGAIVANSWFDLGRDSGTGVVNLSGGSITKLTGTGQLNIGSSGTGHGTLNQSGGTITNTAVDTLVARDPATVGVWNMTGGTATLANLLIGASGNGTVNVTGSDAVTLSANQILIGGQNGNTGVGTLNISNPNAVITSINEMGTGRNGGHGEVHQSAGVVNAGGGWFGIANDPQDGSQPVTGLYDISGGQLNALSANVELGADGQGELRVSGTGQVTVGSIHAGQRAFGTGTLNLSDSGSVTASGQIVIGFGSANANVANVSGGTMTSGSEFQVGQGGGHTGTLNFSGGTITSTGEFQVGNDGGTGTVTMDNGTLNPLSYFGIGRTGGTGVFNLNGGQIIKTDANGDFSISTFNNGAAVTTGTLNQNGGTITVTTVDTDIARDAGNVGFWNMLGGTANLANFFVGNGGDGTLNQSAGLIAATAVTLANQGGSIGTANLTGGTLAAQFIQAGAGTVNLNMDGGTLRAAGDQADFLRFFDPTNSEVLAGGVKFDTNGFNISVNNQFDGVGGLVKEGEGNLTVSNAANANTGGTIVNRGNVIYPVISAAGPGAVDILINGPGAAALDGTDLTPLQARTITTSNGAIALHDNTASVALDFTAYPNLSLGSVGISSYGLALTPGGGNYRLGGGGGTLTVSTPLTGANGLIVNGNGLKGTVVLTSQETYTGPTNVAGGIAILAGGVDTLPATALTIGATATVGMNGNNQTVGSLTGAAGAVLNNSGAAAVFTTGVDNTSTTYDGLITGAISVVKVGTGTQTISAPQTYTALSVNAGAVVLGGTNNLNSLSLANNTSLTLSAHTGGPGAVKAINTTAFSMAGNAKLDLTNNAMVVHGGSLAAISPLVASGSNGLLWDGPGINSSTAHAVASGFSNLTAVGIIDNSVVGYTEFAGVTGLTGNEILLKYTYYGDSDLSGQVTLDDFFNFNDGFTGALPASWFNGDYDYSGAVTLDDFFLFNDNFTATQPALRDVGLTEQLNAIALGATGAGTDAALTGGGGLDAGGGLGGAGGVGSAVVPEPGSIGLLAVGALGLLARRRRTRPCK